MGPLLPGIDASLLSTPETPFVATHAALALAGDHDLAGLAALERHLRASSDATMRTVVEPICVALLEALEDRWEACWRTLTDLLPMLPRVSGSAAQREVVEETMHVRAFLCVIRKVCAYYGLTLEQLRAANPSLRMASHYVHGHTLLGWLRGDLHYYYFTRYALNVNQKTVERCSINAASVRMRKKLGKVIITSIMRETSISTQPPK